MICNGENDLKTDLALSITRRLQILARNDIIILYTRGYYNIIIIIIALRASSKFNRNRNRKPYSPRYNNIIRIQSDRNFTSRKRSVLSTIIFFYRPVCVNDCTECY